MNQSIDRRPTLGTSAEVGVRPNWDLDTITQGFISHAEELARLSLDCISSCTTEVVRSTVMVADALRRGGKVMACGNGGSAADAQHFVAEFVGRYSGDRIPMPAISLTSDSSVLTALGNDYGFEEVFARQVRALAQPADVFVAISTSGRSSNILKAISAAHDLGVGVIVLTGESAALSLENQDVWCRVRSTSTSHVQEVHTMILHSICIGVEKLFDFGKIEK